MEPNKITSLREDIDEIKQLMTRVSGYLTELESDLRRQEHVKIIGYTSGND